MRAGQFAAVDDNDVPVTEVDINAALGSIPCRFASLLRDRPFGRSTPPSLPTALRAPDGSPPEIH
jgi:hypothetical protein